MSEEISPITDHPDTLHKAWGGEIRVKTIGKIGGSIQTAQQELTATGTKLAQHVATMEAMLASSFEGLINPDLKARLLTEIGKLRELI